jgi:ABC-type Mn2+/Zn2+ transport system permease subunit
MTVIQQIGEAMSYPFVQKALMAGTFLAISCSLVGIFIVLRKVSMIGDGLAHVSFASVAIALFLGAQPLWMSIPIVVSSAFLIQYLHDHAKIDGDATIGILSSSAMALGIMIASLSSGLNIDIYSYLFGSILTIETADVIAGFILVLVSSALIVAFYNDLFSMSYDEEFATVIHVPVKRMNYVLLAIIALTVIIGIRVVGTLLISSLIILPTVTALQFGRGFRKTMVISAICSVVGVWSGIFLSFLLNTPSGATIVLFQLAVFISVFALHKARG